MGRLPQPVSRGRRTAAIAAPAAVPGVDGLIGMLDGVVVVGDATTGAFRHVFAEVVRHGEHRRGPQREARLAAVSRVVDGSFRSLALRRRPPLPSRSGRIYLTRHRCRGGGAASRFGRGIRQSGVRDIRLIDSSPPLAVSRSPPIRRTRRRSPYRSRWSTRRMARRFAFASGGGDFPVGTYAPVSRGADRRHLVQGGHGRIRRSHEADQLLASFGSAGSCRRDGAP